MTSLPVFTLLHKILLAIAVVILLAAGLWSTPTSPSLTPVPGLDQEFESTDIPAETDDRELQADTEKPLEHDLPLNTVEHQVQSGDSLSNIFQAGNAPLSDLYKIMEADTEYLSLATLVPGTRMQLRFDQTGAFEELRLQLDAAREVIYSKQPDGSFVYQEIEADTHWVSEVLRGSIEGSLYGSALGAGLSEAQIMLIDQLLGRQLNFRRDLRAGDQFAVVIGHEMTGQQVTGNTRLEAISLARGSKKHSAFRFDDGTYYDESGDSVTPAFLRWPTGKRYRVSSHFNANRLHPVTGRRAPHNGVDLATPIGTPVVTTGDGIVRRVGNHPYAGKYIDIDHGGSHATRYLHLDRILVRRGAQVKRGDRIALSGNTGRSTGPHLHFELHINGRPVDPLKADIPTAANIAQADASRFEKMVVQHSEVMEHAASRSDILLAKADASFD